MTACLQALRLAMIEFLYGCHYNIYPFYVDCADVGHTGCSRARVYIILAHKEHVELHVGDMYKLYDHIKDTIMKHVSTKPVDYLTATAGELIMEAQELAFQRRNRGKRLTVAWLHNYIRLFKFKIAPCCQSEDSMVRSLDFRGLLLPRERKVLSEVCKKYRKRFRRDPNQDSNLFVFLGDSASRNCWSAVSGKIPTLRRNTGRMWHVKSRRWLTGRERMATLGFPVDVETSTAMGLAEPLPTRCTKRAALLAGNAAHLGTTAVMQLLGMVSFTAKH